jgi:competence ComEA-like helix-hairpin-helix protein
MAGPDPISRPARLTAAALLVLGAVACGWLALASSPVPRLGASPDSADQSRPGPARESASDAARATDGVTLNEGPRHLVIDLNTATAADLEVLPRIGPALAQRIIEARDRAGGFSSLADLDAVKGIGPRTLEALRPHVRVGPRVPRSSPTAGTPTGSR